MEQPGGAEILALSTRLRLRVVALILVSLGSCLPYSSPCDLSIRLGMDSPRLLPGDEPGSFVVYLSRPGRFEFSLVPVGRVYYGPLRITINVEAPTFAEDDVHHPSPIRTSRRSSSQTSSPVETSQPDWDLPIPASRPPRGRSYSERPITVRFEEPPSLHPPSPAAPTCGHANPSRSPSPASASMQDAGSLSSDSSILLDGLMELFPTRAHVEAAFLRCARILPLSSSRTPQLMPLRVQRSSQSTVRCVRLD
ncbi:hypothetical protein BV25DRAFT_1918436 [Artomyces pyxidatus]|uniref:Uncharacterized protein n=1 Tax=Artomyces pyxidatus TaxID=48021 RepID=A0ACB8STX6_9AGAM|nr:hypothetical protein BV25DRAFT_1918436 [Artomyces pyxidatus]